MLSVKNLEIGYTDVLAKITFDLMKGQKLGIIGANGIGKSTFLKTLMGKVEPISGDFEFGYNVEKQYFDQELAFANSSKTIFDEFSDTFPALNDREVRSSLAAFLFTGEEVFKEISVLSGGEKVRLKLCEIFKRGPNLLLLDEPTNHMDILGKESLERILNKYEGTLVFVSHDRYFVSKIATALLIFENDKVTYFDGNYDEYIEKKQQENAEEVIIENIQREEKKPPINSYFANKEKNKINNRIKKLEELISKKEEEVSLLEQDMQKEEICADYIKLTEIQNKMASVMKEIEDLMQEWEELGKKLDLM